MKTVSENSPKDRRSVEFGVGSNCGEVQTWNLV